MCLIVLLYLFKKHLILLFLDVLLLALLLEGLLHDLEVAKVAQVVWELLLDQLIEVWVRQSLRSDELVNRLIEVKKEFVLLHYHVQLSLVYG
jgi:hypothetical protein